MAKSWLRNMLKGKSRPLHKEPRQEYLLPLLEPLGERILPSVTATFTPSVGVLTVIGDSLDNSIVISRNAAGQILINGGNVPIHGGNSTVANVSLIQVFGQAGNDTLTLNEANG